MLHFGFITLIIVDKHDLENGLKKITPGQGILQVDEQVQGVVESVCQFYLNNLGCLRCVLQQPGDILVVGFIGEPG